MVNSQPKRPHLPRRNVRLDTLVRLRWLSIIGQTLAVLITYFVLEYDLPIWNCLAVIACAVSLNIVLHARFRLAQRLEPERTAWLLGFDLAELALLIYFTGGLDNPFAFFFLGPVLIAATALPPKMTVILGTFAIVCSTVLIEFHYPLPWSADDNLVLTRGYVIVNWISMVLATFFIGIYAWQITEESRQLVNALAATELVLAREQHLSQIDGLAAAAAHALGTPLSTISVIAKELERAFDAKSAHGEDIRLLREQAQRCRDILGKLNELSATDEPFGRLPLSALLEEVAAPHRDFGITIDVRIADAPWQPSGSRSPGILYGLGNLVENAVDYAHERVEIAARWNDDEVVVTISDDGPGFAPEVISRVGEPYVRSSRRRRRYASEETGLGLGFFIAKTLLERSGAQLTFVNREYPERGAIVTVRWTREDFEQLPQSLDLENATTGS